MPVEFQGEFTDRFERLAPSVWTDFDFPAEPGGGVPEFAVSRATGTGLGPGSLVRG